MNKKNLINNVGFTLLVCCALVSSVAMIYLLIFQNNLSNNNDLVCENYYGENYEEILHIQSNQTLLLINGEKYKESDVIRLCE
jgi:hypothetical protein